MQVKLIHDDYKDKPVMDFSIQALLNTVIMSGGLMIPYSEALKLKVYVDDKFVGNLTEANKEEFIPFSISREL